VAPRVIFGPPFFSLWRAGWFLLSARALGPYPSSEWLLVDNATGSGGVAAEALIASPVGDIGACSQFAIGRSP